MKKYLLFIVPVISIAVLTACSADEKISETSASVTETSVTRETVIIEPIAEPENQYYEEETTETETSASSENEEEGVKMIDLSENETEIKWEGKEQDQAEDELYPFYVKTYDNDHVFTYEDEDYPKANVVRGFIDKDGYVVHEPDTNPHYADDKSYGQLMINVKEGEEGSTYSVTSKDGRLDTGYVYTDIGSDDEGNTIAAVELDNGRFSVTCYSEDGNIIFKDKVIDGSGIPDAIFDSSPASMIYNWGHLFDDGMLLFGEGIVDTNNGNVPAEWGAAGYREYKGNLIAGASVIYDHKGNRLLNLGYDCRTGFSDDGHLWAFMPETGDLAIVSQEGEVKKNTGVTSFWSEGDRYGIIKDGNIRVIDYNDNVITEISDVSIDAEGAQDLKITAGKKYFAVRADKHLTINDMNGKTVIEEDDVSTEAPFKILEEGDEAVCICGKTAINIATGKKYETSISEAEVTLEDGWLTFVANRDRWAMRGTEHIEILDVSEMEKIADYKDDIGFYLDIEDTVTHKKYIIHRKTADGSQYPFDDYYAPGNYMETPDEILIIYDGETLEKIFGVKIAGGLEKYVVPSIDNGIITIPGVFKTAVLDLDGNVIVNTPLLDKQA